MSEVIKRVNIPEIRCELQLSYLTLWKLLYRCKYRHKRRNECLLGIGFTQCSKEKCPFAEVKNEPKR